MSSLAQRFGAELNERLYERMGEIALIDGVEHLGIFNKRQREVMLEEGGAIVMVPLSFDCNYTDQVARLREGDPIIIKYQREGEGERYCFRRRIPPQGDETKRVILELAE